MKEKNEAEEKKPSQDIVESSIGVLGPWHVGVCFLICLVKFPVAWHQLSFTFLAPNVEFTCADNATDKCSPNCGQHLFNRSLFSETIITQWDLVCSKAWLADLSQTITMLGILVGNMLFGYLSDRYGRRNPLVLAVILQGVSGICTAFTPWFYMFLISRFMLACATGGTMITSFVLVMEIIGIKWRTTFGILYQIPFNLGHLSLPLISYFIRDWRYFQAVLSIPSLFLIIYYWLLPESPRYLLTTRREADATKILTKAAKRNKLPTDNIQENVRSYIEKKSLATDEDNKQTANLLDLVRTRHMRVNSLVICFNWFVCGLCFYGVAYFVGRLGGNIFVNVALNAVIQLPSTFFAIWCTKAWGRKKSLIVADVVSGVSLLLIAATPLDKVGLPWLHTALSTIGMFGLATAFPTVYIYAGELFPTTVRNIGVGTASMCARIGSMVAPQIVSLVKIQGWLTPLIFGIVPLVGAFLCLKLPETLDCKLPDTVEELEEFCSGKERENKSLEMT